LKTGPASGIGMTLVNLKAYDHDRHRLDSILLYCAIIVALVKPLGWYMTRVFNGRAHILVRPAAVEAGLYWIGGVDGEARNSIG